MHSKSENGWVLLFVQTGHEASVADELRSNGYEVLLPMWQGAQSSSAQEPLFPRYLFVSHSEDLDWAHLRRTPGVRTIVQLGINFLMHSILEDGWVRAFTDDLSQKLRTVEDGSARSVEMLRVCSTPPAAKNLEQILNGHFSRLS